MPTQPKTHAALIAEMLLNTEPKRFQSNAYGAKHCAAWRRSLIVAGSSTMPRVRGAPIVTLIHALAAYADQHQSIYESRLGDDYVLGTAWADSVRAVRSLLDGDCGDLDCGTLDDLLRDMLKLEGLNPEGA